MASVFVEKSSNEIVSMQWPICINGSDETTEQNCLDSWHSRLIIYYVKFMFIKFSFSEKTTKIPYGFDIYLVNVKTIKQIAQIFVAFS